MSKSGPAETRALTKNSLKYVPPAPSNLQSYLIREENFERLALGLKSQKQDGESVMSEWERTWQAAGGTEVRTSTFSSSFSEGWRKMDMYYTGTVI